ncbi:PAAR domain-containing protein [Sphingomonas faeni]|uniref:PAAR domain-containing protein n=1 Tax=Sphingomonas faeni TaxID=185950 RepID=UPI0033546E64
MPQAARIGDMEACPNGGNSPIMTGAPTVFIEGRPAARVGDKLNCGGGHTQIESGSPTVMIEDSHAARIGDTTCHKGALTTGAATVFIGNGGRQRVTTLDRAQRDAVPFVRG